jgi:hypothetical protein
VRFGWSHNFCLTPERICLLVTRGGGKRWATYEKGALKRRNRLLHQAGDYAAFIFQPPKCWVRTRLSCMSPSISLRCPTTQASAHLEALRRVGRKHRHRRALQNLGGRPRLGGLRLHPGQPDIPCLRAPPVPRRSEVMRFDTGKYHLRVGYVEAGTSHGPDGRQTGGVRKRVPMAMC